jgi:hypothetical protein
VRASSQPIEEPISPSIIISAAAAVVVDWQPVSHSSSRLRRLAGMASFLRRLVAKSRSSSPQKGTTGAGGNHAGALPPAYPPPLGNIEDDDWAPGPPPCSSAFANHVPNASSANRHGNHSQGHFGHHSHAEQYRLPDQMPMNSLAKVYAKK